MSIKTRLQRLEAAIEPTCCPCEHMTVLVTEGGPVPVCETCGRPYQRVMWIREVVVATDGRQDER